MSPLASIEGHPSSIETYHSLKCPYSRGLKKAFSWMLDSQEIESVFGIERVFLTGISEQQIFIIRNFKKQFSN